MIVELIIFAVTTLIIYFWYSYKRVHRFFEERNVKYLPGWPVAGNIFQSMFLRRHTIEDIDEVYRAFPDEKYVGYIEGTTPIFLIRDPELIKNITVKDFDHFVDHKPFFPEEIEPLFGGSLLMMKGDRWRDMRATLSPAFTGSKMRLMMPFMNEISLNMMEYLKEHQNEDLDVGDLMRRYTNDVIASAAFGLQVNSVKDKDNEFYKTGQSMFNFSGPQRFLFFLSMQFPEFAKKIGFELFPITVKNFFKDIVFSTMQHREKNKIDRPDMIQLLMDATKGVLKYVEENEDDENEDHKPHYKHNAPLRKWTQDELVSQVFIFFVAGFESSATGLVMCVHELAINAHVQEKLYQEIKEFKEKNGKNITYDNFNSLKYLDCVLNETFRKWAAALIMDRQCTKPYELPPPREGGKPCKLKPGDLVYNMVNCLHMDPAYFPNPEVFDPERFSDENKHKIKPFTFMPFGMGPRNCIGSRFAQMEIKVLLFHLVSTFKISKCKKTTDPILLKPDDFNIKALGGTWVCLEARS